MLVVGSFEERNRRFLLKSLKDCVGMFAEHL